MENDKLIENFYLLCSTFLYYKIVPIFIFDGKPTKEKDEELKIRKEKKEESENEYKKLAAKGPVSTFDF